jgi:hypothetical protein
VQGLLQNRRRTEKHTQAPELAVGGTPSLRTGDVADCDVDPFEQSFYLGFLYLVHIPLEFGDPGRLYQVPPVQKLLSYKGILSDLPAQLPSLRT